MKTFSLKKLTSIPCKNDLKHLVNSVGTIYLQEGEKYLVKERLNISYVETNKVTYFIKENFNNMKDLK